MLDMKLELAPGQLMQDEDALSRLASSTDPWSYGRHSQRWRPRPTLGAAADSSAPSGGSNSTLSSESSVGAAVAQEPRRSSRDRLQESAAAFLRRVESMRARRRRRKTDPVGADSYRHLGAMKGDGYAISNIEAPLSLERLSGKDGSETGAADASPLSRWLRGGSVRIGRRTAASWRPSSLNMGEESNAYRKKVQNKLRKRKESRDAPLPPPHRAASCTPQATNTAPLIIYNRSYVDDAREEEVSPSGVRENRANSSPTLAGLGQWRNRSNSCSTTLDRGSECSLASSTGGGSSDQTDGRQRRPSVVRWHSFRRESGAGAAPQSPSNAGGATHVSQLTSGQIQSLRNHALLRITKAVQRYCPSKSAGWGWELPKLMRRRRADPDYRTRRVFGVPLSVVAQRGAGPLPAPITQALEVLRRTALQQVGLFRKSGVRSRIQQLRLACEAAGLEGQTVSFEDFTAFDVADMVKQYLRDLPEVVLTSRVSQMLITIYQYVPADLRVDLIRCALLLLPDESRLALQTLLSFLAEVAAASNTNQMTAHNLAVCLAPSVLAVTSQRSSSASPRRTRRAGLPAQRELDENRAAHECLAELIRQGESLFQLPAELLSRCRFSYLDVSQPLGLSSLGTEEQPGNWRAYTDSCCTALLREARDRQRGWVAVPCVPRVPSAPSVPSVSSAPASPTIPTSPSAAFFFSATSPSAASGTSLASVSSGTGIPSSPSATPAASVADVELAYRKVGDGHRLRLWRAAVEVEAPPSEALQRILRQQHAYNLRLVKWRVVEQMADDAEVYQYAVAAAAPLPATEYCVLRAWRTDLPRGACALVETSVEHPDSPVAAGARRGVVLASRYLVEPCGSGRSKVTHFSRVEQRGLSADWYNRVYGHECARELAALRQSFCHVADGPESCV